MLENSIELFRLDFEFSSNDLRFSFRPCLSCASRLRLLEKETDVYVFRYLFEVQ